jgi:hypothetical protein
MTINQGVMYVMNTNKTMLWIVKGVVTVFNIPATWFVFYAMFEHSDRPTWLAYFNTFMAVLAVDAVFLWVLDMLESKHEPIKRLPAAITSVLMVILVVWIGVMDENSILAFAPRAGMILLVFNDIISWLTDYRIFYRSREHQEQKIRDSEVLYRRKVESQALKAAIDSKKEWFQERHTRRIMGQLKLEDEQQQPVPEHSALPEGVVEVDSGYGWVSPKTGEVISTTSLGKNYTSVRGAQIALARHIKEKSNGRH